MKPTSFDEFTSAQWGASEDEYRAEEARRKDLEARTVDEMALGQMQPERDHHLESERNDVRDANGRTFRTPLNSSWTSFEMRVDPSTDQELVLTTWGNERVHPDFSILIDGVETAVDALAGRPMNRFSDTTYTLPPERTRGKAKVTIRVQARPGKGGPSLVHARIVRKVG